MNATRKSIIGNQVFQGNVYCFMAVALWTLAFPSTELLLKNWDALFIAMMRLLLGTVFLYLVLAALGKLHELKHVNWKQGLMIGGLGFGFGTSLMIVAQDRSSAVIVAVIATSMPIFSVMLEMVFGKERLSFRLVIGIFLAVVGGLIAAGIELNSMELLGGEVIMLISVLLYVWGSRSTNISLKSMGAISRTALTMSAATVVSLSIYIATMLMDKALPLLPPSQEDIILFLILSVGSLAISTIFWFAGITRIGITSSAIHLNAAPFYVMALMTLLGSAWRWDQAVGAVIVILGALIAQGIILPRKDKTF